MCGYGRFFRRMKNMSALTQGFPYVTKILFSSTPTTLFDIIFTFAMLILVVKGELKLSFKKQYNILVVGLLVVFFLTSYLLGVMISSQKSNAKEAVSENTPKAEQKEGQGDKSILYDIDLSPKKQKYVAELCKKYAIPCEVVYGVMYCESSYDRQAVSQTGDWGIMQINEVNHGWLTEKLGVSDFLDFEDNVLCGVYMLSSYYQKYGDLHLALMCYHFGETGAARIWEKGIYESDYSRAVMGFCENLKAY